MWYLVYMCQLCVNMMFSWSNIISYIRTWVVSTSKPFYVFTYPTSTHPMSVLIFYPSPCPEGIRASSAVATHTSETFLFFCFFFHPIYYLRPSVLSLLVVTQIRGHIAGCSSPLPTTVRALHFYHEKISGPSLVDSRRVVLTHARRSQQLILF